MEFLLLGPLEVRLNDRSLDLGGRQQRMVLALLLLHANEVVASERLIDGLWAEHPPETASPTLQGYISKLRKLVGRDRILTQAPGYRLVVHDGELDLSRFRQLVAEARGEEPARAAVMLADALALWRGPPLADLAYEEFAQAETARLEELRLVALEQRIEAELALGRDAELIGELEALVAEHPLRERARGQLMLALYRSGRQAEALEAYQGARRTLVEDLGIEPSAALQKLERRILQQDPELELPREPPAAETAPRPAPRPEPVVKPAVREGRKTVTILFAALTGVPESGTLDPESQRAVTRRAFTELRTILERHGGTFDRLAGDAVTALFGVPVVHEDDALRAVTAAAEVRSAIEAMEGELEGQWGLRLELRVGLSTGEVVTGGADEELSATGAAVASAIRLAQRAAAGEILLEDGTYHLVRDAVVVDAFERPAGEAAAGGDRRLLEVVPGVPGRLSSFESAMVGRLREQRRLQDAFEQAVGDDSCQLFTVLGAAGVGKSRLVQEFLRGLAGRAQVAQGRCLPYGEGITYWPVIEAVKDLAALDDAESPEADQQRLAALLAEHDQADLVARRVAELIGPGEAVGATEESFWAVRSLFEALARRRPLVLVFDDIHWGMATFLDLVEHLADWTRDAPVLLVCIARPELLEARSAWGGGKLNATSILLEPLDDDECKLMIANLLGPGELPGLAQGRIERTAEGNPLFVEEMLGMLIDEGLLAHDDDRWVATADLASVQTPPTIQAVLAARLDRLTNDERAAIERAAVEGKVFHEGWITEPASSLGEPDAVSLAALVRKDLVRPNKAVFSGERAFRFRHLLIRDAAYDSISKAARAGLHEQHARWLDDKAGERAAEYDEIIGYHLEQACRYRVELAPADERVRDLASLAAQHLGAAGRRAFVRGDAAAGVNLVSRAVSLLPPDDPARVDLVPSVRVIQGVSGDLGWANAVLSEAIAAGDRRLKSHALVQQAFLRLFTEPEIAADELFATAEQAIEVFDEVGDELGLARAWRLVAQANYLGRRAGPCGEASERALAYARSARDRHEEQEVVEWLVIALHLGPAPATDASRRCLQLLDEVGGRPVLESMVATVAATLEAMQGRMAEAEQMLARGRRAMDEHGETVGLFPFNAGITRMLAADAAGAELELRSQFDTVRGRDKTGHYSSQAALLAETVYAQARYDEAEQHAREAEETSRSNDVHSQIAWRGTRAKVEARRGAFEAAEALARQAVAFAADSDFLNSHGDALLDLAEVLQLAGRADESGTAIEQALGLYEAKGNLVAAANARTRLAAEPDRAKAGP